MLSVVSLARLACLPFVIVGQALAGLIAALAAALLGARPLMTTLVAIMLASLLMPGMLPPYQVGGRAVAAMTVPDEAMA